MEPMKTKPGIGRSEGCWSCCNCYGTHKLLETEALDNQLATSLLALGRLQGKGAIRIQNLKGWILLKSCEHPSDVWICLDLVAAYSILFNLIHYSSPQHRWNTTESVSYWFVWEYPLDVVSVFQEHCCDADVHVFLRVQAFHGRSRKKLACLYWFAAAIASSHHRWGKGLGRTLVNKCFVRKPPPGRLQFTSTRLASFLPYIIGPWKFRA